MEAVARLSDLPACGAIKTRVGTTDIVLVRDGAEVHAFQATCPHAGAPLHEGAVCGGKLICPWHKAEFTLTDGRMVEPPALDDLVRYPCRIDEQAVLVAPTPPADPAPRRRTTGRTIAIVGSGAAGTAVAAELCRIGVAGRILLIGPEARRPYDRTALSKFVLSGEMPPDEVPPLRDDAFWAKHSVERVDAMVTRLDAGSRTVTLANGNSLTYDEAVLATGAAAKRPNLQGVALNGVWTLRSRLDAACIMSALQPGTKVVIIGSSFIGLEAASALRKAGAAVSVVSPERVPFAKQFGGEIGGMFRRLHEANGVVFHLDSEVTAIEGRDRAEAVFLKTGQRLAADLVLIGIGVAPVSDFVTGVETEHDGGIAVDAQFRAARGLYVAGDCAAFPFDGRRVRIEHWRVAQQQGIRVARAIAGETPDAIAVPFFWTYHYGKRFDYLGHPAAWDGLHVEGRLQDQDFVALQTADGKVVGVIACNRERTTAGLVDRMRTALGLEEAVALIRSS